MLNGHVVTRRWASRRAISMSQAPARDRGKLEFLGDEPFDLVEGRLAREPGGLSVTSTRHFRAIAETSISSTIARRIHVAPAHPAAAARGIEDRHAIASTAAAGSR